MRFSGENIRGRFSCSPSSLRDALQRERSQVMRSASRFHLGGFFRRSLHQPAPAPSVSCPDLPVRNGLLCPQTRVTQPTPDDRDVNAGGVQMDRGCVAKKVRCDALLEQRWSLLSRHMHILAQTETEAGGSQRFTAAIGEQWNIGRSGDAPQQGREKWSGFLPPRSNPLFSRPCP